MRILKTVDELLNWRIKQSGVIGLVPTMGALHLGHLSLVKKCIKTCSLTVVSIFINPTQFSEEEDLKSYPKTINEDRALLEQLHIDVLFLPTEKEMYEKSSSVNIPKSGLFKKLEGISRPHFFYGVTTIVAKLFNAVQPTHAFFGQKDAQQLFIIEQMITKMNYPIKLVACPTIRDLHGLALSSRNHYLTIKQQQKASIIYSGLKHIKQSIENGQNNTVILKESFKTILKTIKEIKVEYISIACATTLNEVEIIADKKLLISTAVLFKNVRLIDNFIYQSST